MHSVGYQVSFIVKISELPKSSQKIVLNENMFQEDCLWFVVLITQSIILDMYTFEK